MVEVKVSEDGMEASVMIKPEPDEALTEALIENTLRLEGVQTGIDKEAIASLVNQGIYNTFEVVATGKKPVDGVDGYFEYLFTKHENGKRPRIREDGSVDYTRSIVNVSAGDLLAVYHPEKNGTFGYNVFAKALAPYRGKPKRQLRCINVRYEDGKYYAEKSGHVAADDSTISIQNVLEINGNASYDGGDITFNGDVHVTGNVDSGITVRAAGSVIVEGVVESAIIYAGKDIIVNRGIHGQGTHKDGMLLSEGDTMLEAQGNLSTRFIDHAFVNVTGNVLMDYAVGSVIYSEGKVTAQGAKGTIAGGSTSALLGVDAEVLGNQSELPTEIKVGDAKDFPDKLNAAREKKVELDRQVARCQDSAEAEKLREALEEAKAHLQIMEQKAVDRQTAPVIVRKALYPCVKMMFGKLGLPDMAGKFNVEFRKIGGSILCKTIGHFTQKELLSCLIDTESQVLTEEKPAVLIIDDDTRLLRTVHHILEDKYQVAVATSGRTARKYLESNAVELILLDYMMPEENGVEVLVSFRNWDKTKNIPVVFLTGINDKKKILECLSLHPAGYIQKPVNSESLLAKVHAILGV